MSLAHALSPDAWITLTVLLLVLVGLVRHTAGPDLVLGAGLLALLVAGVVPAQVAFAGFSNEGVLSLAALLVVAAGVKETGGIDAIAERLLGHPRRLASARLRLVLPVALLSAFTGNTAVVAMGIPVVQDWARRLGVPASRLLLPLSYAAILGGMCTLIGTSTHLVVLGLYQRAQPGASIGLFEVGLLGGPALVVGVLYMLAVARWLPPARGGLAPSVENPREYSVVMRVEPGSVVAGKTVEAAGLRHLPQLFLSEIQREGVTLPAPGPATTLREGDHLVFVGVVDSVKDLTRIPGLAPAEDQVRRLGERRPERSLVEAVVSGSSRLVGQSVREAGFRTRFDAAIIAVHRRGERIQRKIGDIVLEAGDVLLMEAHPSWSRYYRSDGNFLLVSEVEGSRRPRRERAGRALFLLGAMVGTSAMGLLPLLQATLLAAAGMVLLGCLQGSEVRRALDLRVLIAVASAFGLGLAVEHSGLGEAVGALVQQVGARGGPLGLLAVVYVLTAVLTELVTNAAAAALVFPVALSAAQAAHLPALPFVLTLMIAASASFATPIGYQTNLMVYGPGGYRFGDYTRFGLPLQILVAATVIGTARLLWW
jgi:di/tricarboxylate transporter